MPDHPTCAGGLASKAVAAELGVHEHTVGKWRRRFLKDRVDGLLDETRSGRPRTIDDEQVAEVIDLILHPEKNLSSVRTIT
jgi:transposase